jgi:hypothetical protein
VSRSANLVALPSRPRRTVWSVSLLAAALGLPMVMLGTGGGEVTAPNPDDARGLRDEAIAACDAYRWHECKQKLDKAKALDPKGRSSRAWSPHERR